MDLLSITKNENHKQLGNNLLKPYDMGILDLEVFKKIMFFYTILEVVIIFHESLKITGNFTVNKGWKVILETNIM